MKLLERVSNTGLRLHLAPATIDCYQRWIKNFLAFHRDPHGQWIHPHLETTMIYTHVMNKPAIAVTSPLDRLAAV